MDDAEFGRISDILEAVNKLILNALDMRIIPLDPSTPSRIQAENLSDAMVHFANVGAELEHGVAQTSIIMQHLQVRWDLIAGPELSKPRDRWMDKKGMLAKAVAAHERLYGTLERCRVTVEAGKRAVDRISSLQAAASRAAGIFMGPT